MNLITDEMDTCCTTQTLLPLVIGEHTPVTLTAINISRGNNTKYIYYWLNHRECYITTLMHNFNFLKHLHSKWMAPSKVRSSSEPKWENVLEFFPIQWLHPFRVRSRIDIHSVMRTRGRTYIDNWIYDNLLTRHTNTTWTVLRYGYKSWIFRFFLVKIPKIY